MINITKEFKILDKNFQCGGFQYEIGKTYYKKPQDATGFSFCTDFNHLFDLQPKDEKQQTVVEVYVYGDLFTPSCTNKFWKDTTKITIIREVSFKEVYLIERLTELFDGYINETTLDDPQVTAEKMAELTNTIAHMDEKEKYILGMRFCVLTGRPETLITIGKELGITRERVRQLVQRITKALLKDFNLEVHEQSSYPDLQRVHHKLSELST